MLLESGCVLIPHNLKKIKGLPGIVAFPMRAPYGEMLKSGRADALISEGEKRNEPC